MNLAVIIPAAGASSRYTGAGGLRAKIDEDLGGRPVLQRTVELFSSRDDVSLIVVAGPATEWNEFVARHGDKLGLLGVRLCKGGAEHRWQSVKNALDVVIEFNASGGGASGPVTHVAIHDAARPGASQELIDRCVRAAEKHAAVIPALDAPDTIKRVSAGAKADREIDPLDAILGDAGKSKSTARTVEATVSRENLVLVQTPQVFELGLLRRAYAQADLSSTDDAGLVEKLGEPVAVVEGEARNLKITRPADLHLIRQILGLRGPAERETHKRF